MFAEVQPGSNSLPAKKIQYHMYFEVRKNTEQRVKGAIPRVKASRPTQQSTRSRTQNGKLSLLSSRKQEEGVKPIKTLVRSYVREATLLSNVGAEVSFQLPNDASPSFQGMLTEIDTRKVELGINRYIYVGSIKFARSPAASEER